ncbi:MAG: hypothetical protein HRU19_03635 [Pseudobacteriovorax sp.]|nr:hypothetical protein [Pseudobacteriovorax sp.]
MNKPSLKASMLEKEYFLKKDRELIDKIKHDEEEKKTQAERALHFGKCSHCGAKMLSLEIDAAAMLFCESCHAVQMNLHDLDNLSVKHKLKHAISELLIKAKYNKSA